MQGKSDCRTVNSEHTQEQLENVVNAFREAGKKLAVI